ncbi:MAG: CinA family nicotinamide mononucleotide deamidase-related protein [Eubacteriales bacterium]|nr:CinA family nicotinamide mononucleotide deamidase-related protein [Eubacteriales bacterium]
MARKRCEILCVGTELLLGDILNTNARFLAQEISQLGLDLYFQTVVGDNPRRMEEAVRLALSRSDFLLITGGLGPTSDDITKDVVARVFDRPLVMHEPSLRALKAFYETVRRPMPNNNERQALAPEGAQVLENPQGTAPGYIVEDVTGHAAILLPGPPRELQAMFRMHVAPYLRQFSKGLILSRMVRVIGLGESRMAEMLEDLIVEGVNPTLAPYAREGEAFVRVTARGDSPEEALRLTEPVVNEIIRRLGRHVYGVDVDSLEAALAQLLKSAGLKVAIAEAGTAGLAASRLMALPGAGGVVGTSISAEHLEEINGLIEPQGPALPASPEAACEKMAAALGQRLGVPAGIAITVNNQRQYACAVWLGGRTSALIGAAPSPRDMAYVRTQAVQNAFDLFRHRLMDVAEARL